MDVKEFARLGGLARAAKLTPERRTEIARKAGLAGKGIKRPGSGRKPKVTHA